MMISTHMAYGFVFAFALASIFAHAFPTNSFAVSSGYFAIFGALGGVVPDLDRMEQIGMTHRKTLHYAVGWGIVTLFLIIVWYSFDLSIWFIGVACLFSGAWLHSFMDIFDDFYKDPTHGIYEHISRKWIKPFRWIPFASLQEWSLQSFCVIGAIAVSHFLGEVSVLQGWLVAVLVFLAIWLLSTVYEFRYHVPKRLEKIRGALEK
jgi:hypothetical protein